MQTWLGTHHLGTHGWLRLAVAAALVLVLILTLEASPAAGASRKACRVTNTDSGRSYTALQAAVDAASRADRLIVKGTCVGETVIKKDLVIVGVADRAPRQAHAVRCRDDAGADGDGRGSSCATLTSGGDGPARQRRRHPQPRHPHPRRRDGAWLPGAHCLYGTGGGIYNVGRLVLNGRTRIADNSASGAGGIHNEGTLILNGSSSGRRERFLLQCRWDLEPSEGDAHPQRLEPHPWQPLGRGHRRGRERRDAHDERLERHQAQLDALGRVRHGRRRRQRRDAHDERRQLHRGHREGAVENSGRFTMSGTSSDQRQPATIGGVSNGGGFTMNDSSSISGNTGGCLRRAVSRRTGANGSLTMNDRAAPSPATRIDREIDVPVVAVGWQLRSLTAGRPHLSNRRTQPARCRRRSRLRTRRATCDGNTPRRLLLRVVRVLLLGRAHLPSTTPPAGPGNLVDNFVDGPLANARSNLRCWTARRVEARDGRPRSPGPEDDGDVVIFWGRTVTDLDNLRTASRHPSRRWRCIPIATSSSSKRSTRTSWPSTSASRWATSSRSTCTSSARPTSGRELMELFSPHSPLTAEEKEARLVRRVPSLAAGAMAAARPTGPVARAGRPSCSGLATRTRASRRPRPSPTGRSPSTSWPSTGRRGTSPEYLRKLVRRFGRPPR